jgi:hypothetical protein
LAPSEIEPAVAALDVTCNVSATGRYANAAGSAALCPVGSLTVTFTTPAAWAGTVPVMVVELTTVTAPALVAPNRTV